ncbi:hypothetical protein GCM10010302_04300 [Streptomyces polychromogenes]|uniref:Uncharacterized protein n=1 Tax=Streptomyces polychromogenes TaxID=67342 RepID=A0ABP3EPS6_9ACTN
MGSAPRGRLERVMYPQVRRGYGPVGAGIAGPVPASPVARSAEGKGWGGAGDAGVRAERVRSHLPPLPTPQRVPPRVHGWWSEAEPGGRSTQRSGVTERSGVRHAATVVVAGKAPREA